VQRKTPQKFKKIHCQSSLHIKDICTVKGVGIWVFSYGCFKFALTSLRIVTLGGKVLKIFMPA
jgi:hypothetical protein